MFNQLPKLYSRTTSGAIQEWSIIVDDNSHYTICGQQNGQMVQTKPTVCKGKNLKKANETTPQAQAHTEALAKWKKKIKEGYRENIAEVDQETFVSPMLAKTFPDHKNKIIYPVGSQIKLNGGRGVAVARGLFTRTGEEYLAIPHINKDLEQFFSQYPNAVIDGELLGKGNKQKLNETMKLIRRTVHLTPEDFIKSEASVRYHVYDIYNAFGVTKNSHYLERAEAVKKLCTDTKYCEPVETKICHNEQEVMDFFKICLDGDEEGAIVRLLDRGYENKRSDALLKVKENMDSEAIILDIKSGKGNWHDAGKIITLKWIDEKGIERIFDASFKGSYEEGVDFLKNKNTWIGREVTFLYMNVSGLGVPNYARVDINNCLKK